MRLPELLKRSLFVGACEARSGPVASVKLGKVMFDSDAMDLRYGLNGGQHGEREI